MKNEEATIKLHIPSNQIIKVLIILAGAYVLIQVQQVIILLFLSFILMASTKPAANALQKKFKIPRTLSIAAVYLGIFLVLSLSIYAVGKPLANELAKLAENSSSILDSLAKQFPFLQDAINKDSLSQISKTYLSDLSHNLDGALNTTFQALNVFIAFITVIIVAIYLFIDLEVITKFITQAFKLNRERFIKRYEDIETQLGAWVRGQLFLDVVVGFTTWVGLVLLDIKFALPLAVFAGIMETIPFIGPIIASVPMVIVGFSTSPLAGLLSLGLAILIQQLESHILVPNVMKKAVGLSPVVTIMSILVGQALFGILGSIIAVPVAAMLSVLIKIYFEHHSLNTMVKE